MEAISTPYCGPAPTAAGMLHAFNLDPVLLGALGLTLAATSVIRRRRIAWLGGWACLVIAFVSPLCALTVALFSARAAHHLILLTAAAPLLALAVPGAARWLPLRASLPLVVLALVLWHAPSVYDQAWRWNAVYWAMQAALICPAVAFWAGVFSSAERDPLEAAACLGALAAAMGLIGAILTFAPVVLYPQHGAAPFAFGLDPLRDQQLAGLLMWAPGLLPLAAIGALMLRDGWTRNRDNAGGAP